MHRRSLLSIIIAGVGIGAVSAVTLLSQGPGAAAPTSLTGTTRSTSGEALDGIAVSARADGSTITTTVFTDEAGEYFFPELAPGTYDVWAQAVGFATARDQATVASHRPARLGFTLDVIDDVTPQLTGSEWLDALPMHTAEDRRMKEIFRVNCTECHQPNLVLQHRFDEQGWLAIIDVMAQSSWYGWTGGPGFAAATIGHHREELAAYLARIRGPESAPLHFTLHPRPTGDAARAVITGYAFPPAETPNELSWHDGSDWSQGAASGGHGAVGPHDVSVDADGNAWVTEGIGNDARTVTKIDTTTGQSTAFKVDGSNGSHGIVTAWDDPARPLWFDAYGNPPRLARLDPSTETFELFTPPDGMPARGAFVTVDPDATGKIWAGTQFGALRFDPETETFSYYRNITPADGFTYGMAGDADGNGWWSQWYTNLVMMANPSTGESKEFVMDPPWEDPVVSTALDREFYRSIDALGAGGINSVPGAQAPRRLGADKTGRTVWVPNWWGSNLAKIDIRTHEVTYYKLPINAHAYFVVVADDHMVWTNLMSDDRVAKFNPETEEWTLFRLPVNGCESRNIAYDNLRGDVWVPCYRAGTVLRLQARSEDELSTLKRASADAGL